MKQKNRVFYLKNYCKIELTNRKKEIIGYALVDRNDCENIKNIRWCVSKGYAYNDYHSKMHIKLLGQKKGLVVDHINRNKLDNRRNNLRHITNRDNVINSGMFSHNTSGVKGVCWDKTRNKWFAKIKYYGTTINLGRFNNIKDASRARKDAELKYFYV